MTFSVNSPFYFSATDATISAWLASSGAFNILENTPGTLASLMDNGSVGTLVNFTGNVSVTNGQTFTVTHDDGLTLIIGGINLGFDPGPTGPVTTPRHLQRADRKLPVPTGLRRMLRGAAVLQVDLPFSADPVPGPIVGTGLPGLISASGGLLGWWRRRKKIG